MTVGTKVRYAHNPELYGTGVIDQTLPDGSVMVSFDTCRERFRVGELERVLVTQTGLKAA